MIRVLIVDDEYIMRQGLKYMIDWEKEGYEIVGEATNGNEALDLIRKTSPHIIISDIVMPLLDGVDFAEAVGRMYPDVKMIILSGYDNFEYVKRTLMSGVVDYVLKPTLNQEELIRILHKTSGSIPGYKIDEGAYSSSKAQILERYLLGRDSELDLSEFNDVFKENFFRLYAINIKKENENGTDITDMLYQKIQRELEKEKDIESMLLLLREELACILFCYRPAMTPKVLGCVESINAGLILLNDSIMGVCSGQFEKLENILAVYKNEIETFVDKAFYYEGRKLLFTEEESHNKEINYSPKFDFYRYNQLLSLSHSADALGMLKKYNAEALLAEIDVYSLKNQIKNMIYQYLDFMNTESSLKNDLRYRYFKMIDSSQYLSEYISAITSIMDELEGIATNDFKSEDERIGRILDYIQANYMKNLTLENLSEEFSFNYFYLSTYFNKNMRESFSDYLNSLRIEHACRLLNESNMPIAHIGGEVGYSDHSYFCRVFKKITGKTPSEYRRSEPDA